MSGMSTGIRRRRATAARRRRRAADPVALSFKHGDVDIPFDLVRSDRRTVSFIVKRDGAVVVRAPREAREADVLHGVARHADWIARKRRESIEAERRRRRHYVDGEPHLYLGRTCLLAVATGEPEEVRLEGARLHVAVSAGTADPSQRVAELLDDWYAREAGRLLPQRLDACWAHFPSNGHAKPTVRLKRMRTRWGSMSPAGRMSLRLDLVRAPRACIDYVIVHELCHLEHPHHGPQFWALVERLVPDWRRRARLLERMLG